MRPDLKRGTFTEEEERTIIEVHRILGNRWAQIAKHLPGRTDNEVKNFWNSCIKKKLIAQGFDPNTHNLLSSHKKKSKTKTNASKSHNHHRFPSNSSSLAFSSDDHDHPETCFPPDNNTTKLQNNTINFECNDNNAPTSTEFPTQFLASTSMDISNSISNNEVNLCGYIIDENSIWSTTTDGMESFQPPMQVMPPPQETIGDQQNLDAALFNMLSLNYDFGDYPTNNILPSPGVYDMGPDMDHVAWCQGNSFQSGSYAL